MGRQIPAQYRQSPRRPQGQQHAPHRDGGGLGLLRGQNLGHRGGNRSGGGCRGWRRRLDRLGELWKAGPGRPYRLVDHPVRGHLDLNGGGLRPGRQQRQRNRQPEGQQQPGPAPPPGPVPAPGQFGQHCQQQDHRPASQTHPCHGGQKVCHTCFSPLSSSNRSRRSSRSRSSRPFLARAARKFRGELPYSLESTAWLSKAR